MATFAGYAPNVRYNPETLSLLNYSATNPVGGATAFNLGGGENLASLSEFINSLTRHGQSAALGARIPGGPALEAESSANIGSELQGQLPADVLANLRQASAERGVATGSPASPNSNAAYLRALGLTSLDLTREGQSELTAAEGRNPAAPIFDPTTQLLTPYQAGTLGLEEQRQQNDLTLARQRLAQQAALAGARAAGGQPDTSGLDYVRQPYASDLQTTFVYPSPYAGTSTGTFGYQNPVYGTQSSLGGAPTVGTGTFNIEDTLPPDLQAMYEQLFPGAAPMPQLAMTEGSDQSGGQEGQ